MVAYTTAPDIISISGFWFGNQWLYARRYQAAFATSFGLGLMLSMSVSSSASGKS